MAKKKAFVVEGQELINQSLLFSLQRLLSSGFARGTDDRTGQKVFPCCLMLCIVRFPSARRPPPPPPHLSTHERFLPLRARSKSPLKKRRSRRRCSCCCFPLPLPCITLPLRFPLCLLQLVRVVAVGEFLPP